MRLLLILCVLSGCVRRVATAPNDLGAPPAEVPNATAVTFEGDRDGLTWQVIAGNEAPCFTPCSRWVDPTRTIQLQASTGEGMYLDDLASELDGARHAIVVAQRRNRAEQVNGIVFTTLGSMTSTVAITLTAVGCSDTQRRGGMCTAGLITGAVGIPLMVVSIWMIVDSAPKALVIPVHTRGTAVSAWVTPAGIVGTF